MDCTCPLLVMSLLRAFINLLSVIQQLQYEYINSQTLLLLLITVLSLSMVFPCPSTDTVKISFSMVQLRPNAFSTGSESRHKSNSLTFFPRCSTGRDSNSSILLLTNLADQIHPLHTVTSLHELP